jgi:hypothetical protein
MSEIRDPAPKDSFTHMGEGPAQNPQFECEDDEAVKERAKLLVDGQDVELWDGARKIAEWKIAEFRTAH